MATTTRIVTLEIPRVGLIPKKTVCRLAAVSDRTLLEWSKPGKDGSAPLFPVKPVISGRGKPNLYSAEQILDWFRSLERSPIELPMEHIGSVKIQSEQLKD